jgi:hypothetical protein
MTELTIEQIAKYLESAASVLLSDPPFNSWSFERSVDPDLALVDYVSAKNGMDFVCGLDEKVSCIFIYFNESRSLSGAIQGLPLTSCRQDLIHLFGKPSKSGAAINDPIFGEYGAWDRFLKQGYCVHIQYRINTEQVSQVTIMREDMVPL